MGLDRRGAGRRRIVYTCTGELDSWIPAAREFLDTLMPEALSKRTASAILITAGLGNEKIVELTGMCIRSVRALRKQMEEQEADLLFLPSSAVPDGRRPRALRTKSLRSWIRGIASPISR